MSEQKIYCGNGREKNFSDGGSLISVDLVLDGIGDLFKEHGYTDRNGRKHIKLNISKRREVGQYGDTHAVTIDTWKPEQQQAAPAAAEKPEDDMPF